MEPTLRDYIVHSRPYWRRAGAIVAIGTVLSVVIAFLWPPTYRARTTLLPPSEEDTGFSVTSLLRGLSLPGVRIPSRSGPEDIAVTVLQSHRIMGALVDKFSLMEVYGVDEKPDATEELSRRSNFNVDPSGTVVITVEDRDAQRAADLANAYVEELDHFNREIRMTKGRRMRIFIEERLADTQTSLATAEDEFTRYQREHSTVVLSSEQISSVEIGATLFTRQAALRVRLGMVRQYASESSEEVRLLRQELEQVNFQISRLPDVGLELARRMRGLRVQEQMFVVLSAQYEEARLNEVRDVATLEVLDTAEPPHKPVWPRKFPLIAIGLVLSVFSAAGWTGYSIRRAGVAA